MTRSIESGLSTERLPLKRLGSENRGGLILCSLPLPRGADTGLSLGNRPSYRHNIGQWCDEDSISPRRLLLATDGGETPEEIRVTRDGSAPRHPAPQADMESIEISPDPALMWERHSLRISWNGASVELSMGLRTGGEVHWWENCNLVVLDESPFCRTVEMGGAIALVKETREHRAGESFFSNSLLHKHNWLNGHIFARLYANGVCEIYTHHVNARFFDDGLALEDAVPVIGFRTDDPIPQFSGIWDGAQKELELGDVHFDLEEVARLATPEQPGSLREETGFLTLQPYAGMELYGGDPTYFRTGSYYVCQAEDRQIPRGMARTLRFSLSLNPDRSPRIVRYLAPSWWYGMCEEFQPRPLLPVGNEYDRTLEACDSWTEEFITQGGFEDGSLPRGASRGMEKKPEPGWEGEIPYTLLLYAWRTGGADTYFRALRSCYQYTDIAIDHAAKMVRMHAYPPPAFSLPMNRAQACVAGYLETGDLYLLNAGKAIVDNAHWTHKNSWPRIVVGRDASYVRGAAYLYRYLADRHYLDIALDGARDSARAQRPDGSFGDQGGGVGIHGEGAYITKPWMGFMACSGMLDLLELGVGDELLVGAVHKFADWLMRERYEHESGVVGWDYQHYFDDKPRNFNFRTEEWSPLKHGRGGVWNIDYIARFMTFCALEFDDPAFFDAWAEVYATAPEARGSDHAVAQSLQYVTWVQDRLWNARLEEGRIVAEPVFMGERTPDAGVVRTPDGDLGLCWKNGEIFSPAGSEIEFQPRWLNAPATR
jgi:hypothetical protein